MRNYYSGYDDGKGPLRTFIWALGVGIACLLYVFFSAGCTPQKQLSAKMAKHKDVALKICDQMFPAVISENTNTTTEFIQGPTVYHTDTVTADCDTVRVEGGKRIVRIPCPPSTHRIDSVIRTVTISKVSIDQKRVTQLSSELVTIQKDRDKYKGRSKKQWWAISIMGVAICGTVVLRKFKVF